MVALPRRARKQIPCGFPVFQVVIRSTIEKPMSTMRCSTGRPSARSTMNCAAWRPMPMPSIRTVVRGQGDAGQQRLAGLRPLAEWGDLWHALTRLQEALA